MRSKFLFFLKSLNRKIGMILFENIRSIVPILYSPSVLVSNIYHDYGINTPCYQVVVKNFQKNLSISSYFLMKKSQKTINKKLRKIIFNFPNPTSCRALSAHSQST